MTDPMLFALAVLTVLGTPGPTNTLLATSGAFAGPARSLPLLIAEISGYLASVIVVGLLRPVVESVPIFAVGLKIAVALYLFFLSAKLWQSGAAASVGVAPVRFAAVFVTTLLNPKALIFALVIIPFQHAQWGLYLLGFAAMVVLAGFAWILLGTLAGAAAGERHSRFIPRLASVALVVFAGLIVASLFR